MPAGRLRSPSGTGRSIEASVARGRRFRGGGGVTHAVMYEQRDRNSGQLPHIAGGRASVGDPGTVLAAGKRRNAPHRSRRASALRVRLRAAIYREHRWFLQATSSRRSVMGPNELFPMESALATLAESGLRARDRQLAFFALMGHIRGSATFQQVQEYGAAPGQWPSELAELLHAQADRYPTLSEAVSSGTFSKNSAQAFEFGLECILEGIRARTKIRERSEPNG